MTIHLTGFEEQVRAETALRDPHSPGSERKTFYINVLKRSLDVIAVLVSLPIVAPLILILAVLVSLKGGRPFYCQQRIGRNGEVFRMWKLRSMVVNADACLAEHLAANPEARREWEQMQKLKNDPRITPLGRFLRKTSLDELPQLFNVLNGTMSLVGPRPMMLYQQASPSGCATTTPTTGPPPCAPTSLCCFGRFSSFCAARDTKPVFSLRISPWYLMVRACPVTFL